MSLSSSSQEAERRQLIFDKLWDELLVIARGLSQLEDR
jgi:hypothetical protein